MKGAHHMKKNVGTSITATIIAFVIFALPIFISPCFAAPSAHIQALHRSDGFSRGIVISGQHNDRILIGFTDTPFDDGLFLIQHNDAEAVFQVQPDGKVWFISGQQIDLRYILCIVDAVLALFDDAKSCPSDNTICYARAILGFIIKVLNCSEPATT